MNAWSWPSRHVANHIAQQFDATNEFEVARVNPEVVQYVTPTNHGDLLSTIVSADMVNLKKEMFSALAISLRVDGSVDRMQIDNIHVMAKIVSKDGEEKLVFLGFDEPEERGAEGYLGAVISAIRRSGLDPNEVLHSLSSIVTDGEAMNTGHKRGLWALIDKHRMENGDPPLLKIWCAVHRSNLMWKSVVQSVEEVKRLISDAVSVSTHFHQSSLRTKELEKVAKELNIELMRFPAYFEVRWAEFVHRLLQVVIHNWPALIHYWKQQQETSHDRESPGFLKIWTSVETLHLLHFLVDILSSLSRLQQGFQRDDVTIFEVTSQLDLFKKRIEDLQTSQILGGMEERFTENREEESDGTIKFQQIPVFHKQKRGKQHHLYVSTDRDVFAIRNEVVLSLRDFVDVRFEVDEWSVFRILNTFEGTDEEIRQLHSHIASDVDSLMAFSESFRECGACSKVKAARTLRDKVHLIRHVSSWKPVAIALTRVLGFEATFC